MIPSTTRAPRRFRLPNPERRTEDRQRLLLAIGVGAAICAIHGLATTQSPAGGMVAGGGNLLVFCLEAAVVTWVARLVTSTRIPAWRSTVLALAAFVLQLMESAILKKAGLGPTLAAWAGECFVLAVIGQSLLPARFGASLAIAVLSKIVVVLVALAILAFLFTMLFAGVVAMR